MPAGSLLTLSALQHSGFAGDLLLTDLALPDGHALALIRDLAQHRRDCAVMVMSVFGDEDTVIACVEAGAVGYIHKDSKSTDVDRAMVDVMHGASPISPMIARRLEKPETT